MAMLPRKGVCGKSLSLHLAGKSANRSCRRFSPNQMAGVGPQHRLVIDQADIQMRP
ncbi:protein of unknown function [Thiomonas sp. Sup16B3]|nr:protein of unknown function [Thiomonas sp. Sup16B3]